MDDYLEIVLALQELNPEQLDIMLNWLEEAQGKVEIEK